MVANRIVVAVKAVIYSNRKILIIKRASTDEAGAGTWEIPGGKIEFGEEPERALVREVKEEVGLDVGVERICYVANVMTSPTRQVVILAYLCQSENDCVHLSFEHSDYLRATEQELRRLLPTAILSDFTKYGILTGTDDACSR